MEYLSTELDLHSETYPEDEIVGWYATGYEISEYSILLHEFFASSSHGAASRHPIHLTVDTTMRNGRLSIKGYVSSVLQLGAASFGTQFHPIEITMASFDAEKIGLNLISRGLHSKDGTIPLTPEMDNLKASLGSLTDHLDAAATYVNDVIEGKIEPDNKIGRFLLSAVSAVPQIEPEAFADMLDSNIKDLLMILYLSNLIRTQLHLSDRIDKAISKNARKNAKAAAAASQ